MALGATRHMIRVILLSATVTVAMAVNGAQEARADEATFGLAIGIALRDGMPIRDDAWLDAQIDDANQLFSKAGVRFRWTIKTSLPERHAAIHSRADRDALAAFVSDRTTIPIFIVSSLEDIGDAGHPRMGICWKRQYLVIAASASPTVLAHELGHYFGNEHSSVSDNLMSYSRTGRNVFLNAFQLDTIRASSVRFLEAGPLRAL